ncbi:methyl-accepting chemotaxis protein [Thiomicrorhabdus sp. Milos-T2]|uniref:methyl-accepting chemotaxis protein n=1 Tax=Thiomicrorhabdus sp. Milos-T2 TaxID=90814 RepID=UPI00069242A8|nr:methyl-accepting chemotaxis protein [Thiomicrorhabdus sp. Milos-T2]
MFKSLRTRVEIYTVLTILFTAAILIGVFSYQLYQSKQHLLDAMASKENAISKTVLDKTVSQMEKNVFAFTRDKKLFAAIEASDNQAIADRVGPTANRLEATKTASNVRVLTVGGKVLFSRNKNDGGSIDLALAKQSASELIITRGLESVNNEPEIHFSFPLTKRGQAFAVVDLVMDYAMLAESISKIGQNHVMLFDVNGKLISQQDQPIVTDFLQSGVDVSQYSLDRFAYSDKSYTSVTQPLEDVSGNTVGYIATLTDDTEIHAAQDFSFMLGTIAVVLWILIAFTLTKVQFLRAFKPLENMKTVVNNISHNGDFSKRIPVVSQDEVGEAAEAINEMVDTLQKAISESNLVMNAVASGDFSKRITGQHKGDLETLKEAVNQSTQSVEFIMNEILSLVNALSEGDFSAKMDEGVEPRIRNQVESSLGMMSAVISNVNEVLENMAKGDYSTRVTAEASGELKLMADSVNSRVVQTDQALGEISDVVTALADGDLSKRVNSNFAGKFGEVSKSLNGSIDNLAKLISDTTFGVHNLTNNVEQIYQGSQDLNDRTQRQAASLEETTATMDQIMFAVKQTTDNAQSANQLATSARNQADGGAEVMRSTIESMGDIKEASHRIEEIISLIDSIAFQTNLLALNAAVEAARAGEHGRGFAVVAGEVRNLAGKSADAARDIKGLIENAVSAVDEGTERAERSDEALQHIIESIRKVSDIVADISNASGEQAHSITQVGQAIGEIDTVTQQNAALVEESSAASETMKTEASTLASLVSKFKV